MLSTSGGHGTISRRNPQYSSWHQGMYEAHHDMTIRDEAIEAAIGLSVERISDRFLPEKAIDLIDEACSQLRWARPNSIRLDA